MKKLRLIFIALLFCCSCYRVGNLPIDNTPPVFNTFLSGHTTYYNISGNPADSILTLTVNDNDSLTLVFSFSLVSGNPAKYPFSLYIDSLPAGVTTSVDSIVFRLAYNCHFTLHVNADTGYTTINVKLYDSSLGLRIYPVRLHILPIHPAPDCAACIAGNWTSSNNCGIDSCTTIITAIPGMPHWVTMRNICCLGDSVVVNAYISCDSGIIIPRQTSYGYTISGSFNAPDICSYQFISIPDTVIHSGDTQLCIQHIYQ